MPVIVVGDFNMTMNNCIDRFTPKISSEVVPNGPLLQYCEEIGLVDAWRLHSQ